MIVIEKLFILTFSKNVYRCMEIFRKLLNKSITVFYGNDDVFRKNGNVNIWFFIRKLLLMIYILNCFTNECDMNDD
jgi:hypothetical protein